MPATLLALVQAATRELGLAVPLTVAGATDTQTLQFYGLANALGRELMDEREWTALQTQAIINVPEPIVTTATITSGSVVVTGIPANMTPVEPGLWQIAGNGIQTAARVVSVQVANPGDDGCTMDMQATASGTLVPVTISQDTFAVPDDFKSFINRTQWDRTNHWEMLGPMSPQEYQYVTSGIVATGPRRRFRQIGRLPSVFRIWPAPTADTAPSTLSYEYCSLYWATATDGTPKAEFTADSDTCIYEDRVFINGLKYMFFQQKGMEYTHLMGQYENSLRISKAQDGGAKTLSTARRRWPILIGPGNVQDGYFPGP
jgi:hypothetical protein